MAKRTAPPAAEPQAQAPEQPAEVASFAPIVLKRLSIARIVVPVRGITSYISHPWSVKQKGLLGGGKGPKIKGAPLPPRRDTEDEEYEACRRLLTQPRDDAATDGIPAVAFKAAIIGGARYFESVTMTMLKQMIYVHGEYTEGATPELVVPINGKPHKREDLVSIGSGMNKQPDLRWRAEYWPWSVDLIVEFPADQISESSIISLIDAGGRGGIGEWRPSAPKSMTGTHGMFEVDMEEQERRAGAR